MDDLDKKILGLLRENARMTVKEIAGQVSLTSPAVSERIRRMEQGGVIAGYTVRLDPKMRQGRIEALVSLSVNPKDRALFHSSLTQMDDVEHYFKVTGTYSHMVRVSCKDIDVLEKLLTSLQRFGQTNTQIILATANGPGHSV